MNVTAPAPVPADRDRPKLPEIDTGYMPPDLAALDPKFGKLIETRQEQMHHAMSARSAYDRLGRDSIDQARAADRKALTDAALSGKADPGRVHEMAAIAEIEVEYSRAESLTMVANGTTRAIRDAVVEDQGRESLKLIEDRLAEVKAVLTEHSEAVLDALAEADALRALQDTIVSTVDGKGFGIALANGSVSPLTIPCHGMGVSATLAAAQLGDLDLDGAGA